MMAASENTAAVFFASVVESGAVSVTDMAPDFEVKALSRCLEFPPKTNCSIFVSGMEKWFSS
jgi:hypothetical protein